jgi:hypothetical protein
MTEEPLEDDVPPEMADFLAAAVAEVLRTEDSTQFLAWVADEAPRLLAGPFGELPDEQDRRGVAMELGRALWNAVPLPGNGFRPRPLPRPERNDPCPCGSGRKYKKCCGAAGVEGPDFPDLDADVIWALVALTLNPERAAEVAAAGKVPRAALGEVAGRLLDAGGAESALALIEPLFEDPSRLDGRDAAAVAVLIDAYDELELLQAKEDQAERLARELPAELHGTLWENLSRSYAVHGEMERAWDALERSRRADPESPSLGPVEVSLLMAEERTREAGELAQSLLARVRRQGTAMPEASLEFLRQVAEDPEGTHRRFAFGEALPQVERYQAVVARVAERPITPYGIALLAEDPEIGTLEPPPEMEEIEGGWVEAFLLVIRDEPLESDEEPPELDAWSEEEAEVWLSYLEETPEAFDSLLVLADLTEVVAELGEEVGPGLAWTLIRPLLERGLAIIERTLEGRPTLLLPGVGESNQPALELLARGADLSRAVQDDDLGTRMLDLLRRLDPEWVVERREDRTDLPM